MLRHACVVCQNGLMKRVQRHTSLDFDIRAWVMTKDLLASDPMHPADQYERITKLWCPACGLMYNFEDEP